MKAIVCEMCGSQEMVKKDGMYVCGFCGTKYTVEEAKKLITEITGTVKIDKSEENERYLQLARQAKKMKDWKGAVQYYDLVKQGDPSNIEAIYYCAYGDSKEKGTKIANCFQIMEEYLQPEDGVRYETLFKDICDDLTWIDYGSKLWYIAFLNKAFDLYPQDQKNNVVYIKRLIVDLYLNGNTTYINQSYLEKCQQTIDEIRSYDPNYPVSEIQGKLDSAKQSYYSRLEAERKAKQREEKRQKRDKARRMGWVAFYIILTVAGIIFAIVVGLQM